MAGTHRFYSANNYQRIMLGDYGFRILDKDGTSTSPSGEQYGYIRVIKDCEISLTSHTDGGDSSVSELELKEHHTFFGYFTDITMHNGIIIAYLRK